VQQRTTFRLTQVDDHLWVVLSDPAKFPNEVVIASFTTEAGYPEKTCIVEPNEHPTGLTRRSCIAFEFARVVSLEQLYGFKDTGLLKIQTDPITPALLQKIFDSVPDSSGIKDNVADTLITQGYVTLDD
jgi:hypothetical protein